jgi:hypothetical protein
MTEIFCNDVRPISSGFDADKHQHVELFTSLRFSIYAIPFGSVFCDGLAIRLYCVDTR